jgi:hypothetical protein
MTKKAKIILGISMAVVGVGAYLYVKKKKAALPSGTVSVKSLTPAQKKANFIKGLSDDKLAIARSYLMKVGDDTDDSTVQALADQNTLASIKQSYADVMFPNA